MQTRNPPAPVPLSLEELEGQFQSELAEAERWYEGLRKNERSWVEQGKDADEEFTRLYYQEPSVSGAGPGLVGPGRSLWELAGGAVALFVVAVLAWRLWRRRAGLAAKIVGRAG